MLDQIYHTSYYSTMGRTTDTPYDSDGLLTLYKSYIDLLTSHLDSSIVTYNLQPQCHQLSKILQDNDQIALFYQTIQQIEKKCSFDLDINLVLIFSNL